MNVKNNKENLGVYFSVLYSFCPLSFIGKLSSNQKQPTLYYLRFLAIQVISLFYNK